MIYTYKHQGVIHIYLYLYIYNLGNKHTASDMNYEASQPALMG